MADNRAGKPSVSMEDANFVHQATAGAVAEIMMGQLAVERASGDPARNLGQLMVRDHGNKDQQLGQILQRLSLQPATEPDPEQLAQYQQLQNAPADHFDGTYARIFVEEHQWMIRRPSLALHVAARLDLEFSQTWRPSSRERRRGSVSNKPGS